MRKATGRPAQEERLTRKERLSKKELKKLFYLHYDVILSIKRKTTSLYCDKSKKSSLAVEEQRQGEDEGRPATRPLWWEVGTNSVRRQLAVLAGIDVHVVRSLKRDFVVGLDRDFLLRLRIDTLTS